VNRWPENDIFFESQSVRSLCKKVVLNNPASQQESTTEFLKRAFPWNDKALSIGRSCLTKAEYSIGELIDQLETNTYLKHSKNGNLF